MATIVVFVPNSSLPSVVSNRSAPSAPEPGWPRRHESGLPEIVSTVQTAQINESPNSCSLRPMSKRNSDTPGWLRCERNRDRLGYLLPSGPITSVAPPDKRRSDMPTCTYFLQECPTCGRRVEVRVEYLGRRVCCDHCNGRFVAEDPSGVESGSIAMSGHDLISRANRLLQAVEARQTRTA
jgi:hypothetical protein